jgi:hypothetical protein
MSNYQLTEEQSTLAKWFDIRQERNRLLAETDWWAVSDRVMSDVEKKYRQDLRDLPSTFTNPEDVVFPQKIN